MLNVIDDQLTDSIRQLSSSAIDVLISIVKWVLRFNSHAELILNLQIFIAHTSSNDCRMPSSNTRPE